MRTFHPTPYEPPRVKGSNVVGGRDADLMVYLRSPDGTILNACLPLFKTLCATDSCVGCSANALSPRPASRCCTVSASLRPPGRRSTPHGALGLRFLAIAHSQRTEQVASPHGGDRPRKVELDPVRASLDVGTAPTPCEQVKVEERLVARVEDARPLLDDAGPGPQVSEQVREVIEQLWRTIGHGSGHWSVFRPLRKTSSAQPDLSARATSCALSASAGSARAPTSCASRDRSRARPRSPRRQPYACRLEGCWHALPDRQPARLSPLFKP